MDTHSDLVNVEMFLVRVERHTLMSDKLYGKTQASDADAEAHWSQDSVVQEVRVRPLEEGGHSESRRMAAGGDFYHLPNQIFVSVTPPRRGVAPLRPLPLAKVNE